MVDQTPTKSAKDHRLKNDKTNKVYHDDSKIECPCHNFTSLSKIVDDILSSEDRTNSMIDWLNGTTDEIAIRQKKVLSCGKRFQCRYRYGTSFAILRAIRDACAPFQIQPSTITTTVGVSSHRSIPVANNTRTQQSAATYNNSFPPLRNHPGISNILVPPPSKNNNDNDNEKFESYFTATGGVKEKSTIVINTLPTRKKKPKQVSLNTFNSTGESSTIINTLPTRKKKLKQGNSITTSDASGDLIPVRTDQPSTVLRGNIVCYQSKLTLDETKAKYANINSNCPKKLSAFCTEEEQTIERLAAVYVALIENMLVPSTPLEIHLLLELISIDAAKLEQQHMQVHQGPKKCNNNDTKACIIFFQPIFSCPDRCVQFSNNVLMKLQNGILQRLSPFLLKALLGTELFKQRCPTVAENLRNFLNNIPNVECTPPTPESITGTHAIFNLPFEPDRDSRKNFKTAAEVAMYQNRELSRDAFLSQLRFFMTAKSRVFLPEQVDKVRETAKYESRKITNNIFSHNLMWFAQFFCDLLLQIGHAPVEEMDQELLNIVADDRDKLQKLHRRISNKNTSFSSNTRTGFAYATSAAGRKGRNSTNIKYSRAGAQSPFKEALSSYFPGYQEFFLIFLHSVNSYNFGIHLLHQIAKKTYDLITNESVSGVEKRTMDLALLARFLGFLIFSPNWHNDEIDWMKLKPCICSHDCGLNLLDSIGLSLSKIIQGAWNGGTLFLVTPWVTELLKLSKWDSISQYSMTFRQILANLRHIQKHASSDKNIDSGCSMQVVSFHLETFFNESISLPKLTSLPGANLPRLPPHIPDSLDSYKIGLSTASIYGSSPYMENLCDMIMHFGCSILNTVKTPSTKQRKLRPSIVSTTVGTEAQSYLGIESPSFGKTVSPMGNRIFNKLPPGKNPDGKILHTRKKMIDGFFHQHRDLKDICDFAVEQIIKTLSEEQVNVYSVKAFTELKIGMNSSEQEIEEMQLKALELSQNFLRNKLMESLHKCFGLFAPPGAQKKVIDIAVNISIERGVSSSRSMIRDFISSSTKSMLRELERNLKTMTNTTIEKNDIEKEFEDAIASITNLKKCFFSLKDSDSKINIINESFHCVKKITKSFNLPRETSLREFFVQVHDLERVAESFVQEAIIPTQSNDTESWVMLSTLFRFLSNLSIISGYWRFKISDYFGDDCDYLHFFESDKEPSPGEKSSIMKQLVELTERRKLSLKVKNKNINSAYAGIIDPVAIIF